jgi:hypothetical protein
MAEVCGMHSTAKPLLPSYQAVQDNDDGPLELHYLLIECTQALRVTVSSSVRRKS